MNQGTYPLSASMINQVNRIDILANNLANLNTTSFKQDNVTEGTFNHYVDRAVVNGIDPKTLPKINIITNTIPKLDGQFVNQGMGFFENTGRTYDFALKQKDVFFKIETPNQGVTLTRDGNFNIVDGMLVNKNGFFVLDNNDDPVLANNTMLATIALVKTPYENLQKVGGNTYKARFEDKVEDIDLNKDYLLQQHLEYSNVNAVNMMVELIDAQRRLEQAQRGITGIDEITKKMIDTIGYDR